MRFCLDRIAEDEKWCARSAAQPGDEAWQALLDSLVEEPQVREWIDGCARPHYGRLLFDMSAARVALIQSRALAHEHQWRVARDVARRWAHHPEFLPEWRES